MSHTVRRLLGLTGSALVTGVLAVTTTGAAAGTAWTSAPATSGVLHPSIVIARSGQLGQAAAAVRASGGKLGRPLPIINGFTASVSSAAATRLTGSRSVASVTPDAHMTAASSTFDPAYDPSVPGASAAGSTRSTYAWSQGDTGKGVTVALLDTGVSQVPDLSGRVTAGIDLSGEGNSLQDSFGHGTVMAGLIAGNGASSGGTYPGIAPSAKIVSVKVAGRSGATDVSQVLAGLQWIGTFGPALGVDVVNVAWGTPATETADVNPLDLAVERLWRMGIVVVTAAGNNGPANGTITAPGDDPAVITAGAFNDLSTVDWSDDATLDFSSRGPTALGTSKPDLLAPGRSLIATAAPGSAVVAENPDALVGNGYIRGSGTSQATAVTTGAVALLLQMHSWWTPDQVKYALTSTAHPISNVSRDVQGAGQLRLSKALWTSTSNAPHQTLVATGLGSLEGARGGRHVWVVCAGDTTPTEIIGEMDATCRPFAADQWTADQWTADQWTADQWTADQWTADQWTADQWTADQWTADQWTADQWTADQWTASSWDAAPRVHKRHVEHRHHR